MATRTNGQAKLNNVAGPDTETTRLVSNSSTLTNSTQRSIRLRGILKMLFSRPPQESVDSSPTICPLFSYDSDLLEEAHVQLQTKRKRRQQSQPSNNHQDSSQPLLLDLIGMHRYVAFFVIQGSRNGFYSTHAINMRKRLATGYHDSMTIFCIFANMQEEYGQPYHDNTFLQGTGFAILPSTPPLLYTLLNITQLPSIIVMDTTTGRPISDDASLAIEWNDAHDVLNAWQRGKSGLTCSQKTLAVLTCQGGGSAPCVIQ